MNKKNKNDKKKFKKCTKIKKFVKPATICNTFTVNTNYISKSSESSIMTFSESKADKIVVSFNFI